MDQCKLHLITGENNFFGQTRKPWVSLDTDRMIQILAKENITVVPHLLQDIFNQDVTIENSLIFYSFSQQPEVRRYLYDVLLSLQERNNLLIPAIDLLRCHENKGYQEILKRELEIPSLKSWYLYDLEGVRRLQLTFPLVMKTVTGSNSQGVYLVNSLQELEKIINKLSFLSLDRKLDLFRRQYFRLSRKYAEYPDYDNLQDYQQYRAYLEPHPRFILQEFVPGLRFDYRVLILYDRFYVTRRHNRKDDFRASGAKKFDFSFEPETSLLNYARLLHRKFNAPFISLDIACDGDNFYLFEFQALHFGINVYMKNHRFFTEVGGAWESHNLIHDFEGDLARGLAAYLKNLPG